MKIDFEFMTEYGKFSDALHFPDDQPLPSEAEIEAMKQERLNNWIAIVSYVPPPEVTDVDWNAVTPPEGV